MKTPKESFLKFCIELRGYNVERFGKEIPKYIVYWKGVSSKDLILSKYSYKLIKRKKRRC